MLDRQTFWHFELLTEPIISYNLCTLLVYSRYSQRSQWILPSKLFRQTQRCKVIVKRLSADVRVLRNIKCNDHPADIAPWAGMRHQCLIHGSNYRSCVPGICLEFQTISLKPGLAGKISRLKKIPVRKNNWHFPARGCEKCKARKTSWFMRMHFSELQVIKIHRSGLKKHLFGSKSEPRKCNKYPAQVKRAFEDCTKHWRW